MKTAQVSEQELINEVNDPNWNPNYVLIGFFNREFVLRFRWNGKGMYPVSFVSWLCGEWGPKPRKQIHYPLNRAEAERLLQQAKDNWVEVVTYVRDWRQALSWAKMANCQVEIIRPA